MQPVPCVIHRGTRVGGARVNGLCSSVDHPAAAEADESREARDAVHVADEVSVVPPPNHLQATDTSMPPMDV